MNNKTWLHLLFRPRNHSISPTSSTGPIIAGSALLSLSILLLSLFLPIERTLSAAVNNDPKICPYLSTGPWYPASPNELKKLLQSFFDKATPKPIKGKITGLISPHAGLFYSGQCAAHAFKQLENYTGFDHVFILGVAHRVGFYGAAVSDFQYHATPLGNIPVDTSITQALAKEKYFQLNNQALQYEHSIENQLPFLQMVLEKRPKSAPPVKIIPILFSSLNPTDFPHVAAILKKYLNDKSLVIASTDLTHYGPNFGYTPFKNDNQVKTNLTNLDMGIIEPIIALDLHRYIKYKEQTAITMCGFTPVGVLISLFQDKIHPYKGTLMDYYKSGDEKNDYELSVSYASIIISQINNKTNDNKPMTTKSEKNDSPNITLTREEKKTLLTIARQTLENQFAGKTLPIEDIEAMVTHSPALKEKAGVFVTLKLNGDLRGCIGSIIGVEPLAQAVHNNVLKSAFQDPRFYPLQKKELAKITIEISVMTPLQKIEDYKKIRLGIDGVIIRKDGYQAVFLPQVATETGWNLDQFLSHLSTKAGLDSQAYQSSDMEFFIFQALVFSEKEE